MGGQRFEDRKDRVFLRAIQGEYSLKDELRRLRSLPRVQRAEEINFIDGPQAFSKHYLHPEDALGQTLHLHLEEYAPGGRSKMHFHVNEAIFYILDGKEFEIHDGVRYEGKPAISRWSPTTPCTSTTTPIPPAPRPTCW